MGRQGAYSRGAVQRRAPRGARAEPGGRAAGHAEAGQGPSAGGPARRQRGGAARRLPQRSPRRSTRAARSRRRPNGWSTTTISSRRQIRDIRSDLPPGYYRQLPKLADGPFAGYPRVFGVAWAFVAHTDSRFDPEMLCRFVRAYQEVQPLTIGELWAVAITLADRAGRKSPASRRTDRAQQRRPAGGGRVSPTACWASADAPPNRCRRCSQITSGAPLPDAFAVQLVHRLRDQDPRITPALTWLDERLAAQGTTADAVVRDEHQRQGAATVTVRNIITSMRLISDVDWTELFERISLVDDVLAAGSAFRDMDFPTRNLYRSAIEELARGVEPHGDSTSRAAPSWRRRHAARARCQASAAGRQGDPGYHLLAGGRRAFEAAIGFRPPLARLARAPDPGARHRRLCRRRRRRRRGRSSPFRCSLSHATGSRGAWLGLLGVLGAIPAIDAAVALVNRGVTWGFGATLAARAGAARRRARASAHARRRADAADDAGGDRGADRAAGGPSPRQPGRRSAFRAALRLARCRDRAGRRRRGAACGGGGGHRPAQSALWPGARRRPLPAAPSPAGLERRRRAVDRLGAQARQAARAEPAAARRDRHQLPRPRRAAAIGARRTSATSSRSTPTPGCRATRCAG